MSSLNRWRGLRALITDAVEQGTSAVERVHRATAARPFEVLDHIPPIAPGARGVRVIHDATVAGVYETIRQVNRLVGDGLAAAIDLVEKAQEELSADAGEAPPSHEPVAAKQLEGTPEPILTPPVEAPKVLAEGSDEMARELEAPKPDR